MSKLEVFLMSPPGGRQNHHAVTFKLISEELGKVGMTIVPLNLLRPDETLPNKVCKG